METKLILGAVISVIYFVIRIIEKKMRKQPLQLKTIGKNTMLILLCSIIGQYAVETFNNNTPKKTEVFTDTPGF